MGNSSQLWGGRFKDGADATFAEFNRSFDVDRRLLVPDLKASSAHAAALNKAGVISDREAQQITEALEEIRRRAEADPEFSRSDSAEDVHSFIESRLVEMIGDTGKKIHAGRSRNDQVATAFRIFTRGSCDELRAEIDRVRAALLDAAERYRDAVLPGYTHLQRAQPILWAHWCLAYFEMFTRDVERFGECRARANTLPLGAGALAGTSFDVDREAVAGELGFERIASNSLDAVSDRDFAIEFAGVCSVVMMHLSRFAEDLILYCSTEFGFIALSDAVSTGSSLMPQKKNPDSLELIRGKAGRVFGHHTALLATMKGLPLAYNKDMQEDKEAVFDCLDTTSVCLRVARIVLDNLSLNQDRMRTAATTGHLNATELADHLVKIGIPFRSAHDAVGKAVLLGIEAGKELNELSIDELRSVVPEIDESAYKALSLEATLASKSAIGGTSPERVMGELAKAWKLLDGDQS